MVIAASNGSDFNEPEGDPGPMRINRIRHGRTRYGPGVVFERTGSSP